MAQSFKYRLRLVRQKLRHHGDGNEKVREYEMEHGVETKELAKMVQTQNTSASASRGGVM